MFLLDKMRFQTNKATENEKGELINPAGGLQVKITDRTNA